MLIEIKNGDVFDIEQTINGVSKFLWFNNKWYYFEERMTYEYQYNQEDLTKTVIDNDSDIRIIVISSLSQIKNKIK
jgi:hypothetical protein